MVKPLATRLRIVGAAFFGLASCTHAFTAPWPALLYMIVKTI